MVVVNLGGASFNLNINASSLGPALNAAQRQAQAASANISRSLSNITTAAGGAARAIGVDFVEGIAQIGASLVAFQAVQATIQRISDSAREAVQAQRELNAQYGASAKSYTEYAQAASRGTNFTTQAFQRSSAQMATLQRNYGLTSIQIKNLTDRSADLAAASGKDVADAAYRVQAAMRGEAEAAEQLGLTMNTKTVQAVANMTEAQRRNFYFLDQTTKAQILYNELMRQSAFAQGAAAAAAGTTGDSFAKLDKATSSLFTTMSQGNVIQTFVDQLAQAATSADNLLKILSILEQRIAKSDQRRYQTPEDVIAKSGITGGLSKGPILQRVSGEGQAAVFKDVTQDINKLEEAVRKLQQAGAISTQQVDEFVRTINSIRSGAPTATQDLEALTKQVDALAKAQLAADLSTQQSNVITNVDNRIARMKREQDAVEKTFAGQERALKGYRDKEIDLARQAHDSVVESVNDEAKRYDEAVRAEMDSASKAYNARVKAAGQARDGAVKALGEEQKAYNKAIDKRIRDSERERDKRVGAANDVRDAALAAIRTEQDQAADRRLAQDRNLEDSRRREDRDRQTSHDKYLKQISEEYNARLDQLDRERQGIEDNGKAAQQALQDEAQAAQDASTQRLAGLDAIQQAEERRHTEALDNIDREQAASEAGFQRQLDEIDKRNNRFSLQQQARQSREDLTSAGIDLQAARRTGDPEQIRRAELVVQNVRSQIEQAGEDRRTQIERKAINDRAAQVRVDFEKRRQAEEEATQNVAKQLQDRREKEQDALKNTLDILTKQRDAASQASDSQIGIVQKQIDEEQRLYQERTDADSASWNAVLQNVQDAQRAEDRAIQDMRAAQEKAWQARQDAAEKVYAGEIDLIQKLYDDPDTGIIAKIRQEQEAAIEQFQARGEAIDAAYQAEQEAADANLQNLQENLDAASKATHESFEQRKKDADEAYDRELKHIDKVFGTGDPSGSGLLDKLAAARDASRTSLQTQIDQWSEWEKAIAGPDGSIQRAIDQLDILYLRIKEGKDLGLVIPASPDDIRGAQNPGGLPPGVSPRDAGLGGQAAFGGSVNPIVRTATHVTNTAHGTHEGGPAADIFAPPGSPIYAPVDGVSAPAMYPLGGNTTTLRGTNGKWYYMAHGRVPFVGGNVRGGEQIGEVGNTGNAAQTASHVHFAITDDGDFSRGKNGGSGNVWPDGSYWQGGPDLQVDGEGPSGSSLHTLTLFPFGPFGPPLKLLVKPGDLTPNTDIANFVAEQAKAAGIDPYFALQVAMTEGGLSEWAKAGDFNTNGVPSSFGPFQMHYGNLGEPHHAMGLGDAFTKATGLDARNVEDAPEAIAYALKVAKQGGWGPWHGWTGDPWAGIKGYAEGGWINEHVMGVGMRSGRGYSIGENGSELVIPKDQLTSETPDWVRYSIRSMFDAYKATYQLASQAYKEAKAKGDAPGMHTAAESARRAGSQYHQRLGYDRAYPVYEAAKEAQPQLQALFQQAVRQGNVNAAAAISDTYQDLLRANKETQKSPGRASFDKLVGMGYKWDTSGQLVSPWGAEGAGYFGLPSNRASGPARSPSGVPAPTPLTPMSDLKVPGLKDAAWQASNQAAAMGGVTVNIYGNVTMPVTASPDQAMADLSRIRSRGRQR
jgi:hypothetical protein